MELQPPDFSCRLTANELLIIGGGGPQNRLKPFLFSSMKSKRTENSEPPFRKRELEIQRRHPHLVQRIPLFRGSTVLLGLYFRFFWKIDTKKGVLLYLGGLQYGHSARFIYARAIARYHALYLRSVDRDSSARTFTEGALQLFSPAGGRMRRTLFLVSLTFSSVLSF